MSCVGTRIKGSVKPENCEADSPGTGISRRLMVMSPRGKEEAGVVHRWCWGPGWPHRYRPISPEPNMPKTDPKWTEGTRVKGNARKLVKMETFDFEAEKDLTSKAPAVGPQVGGPDDSEWRVFVHPGVSWKVLRGHQAGDPC